DPQPRALRAAQDRPGPQLSSRDVACPVRASRRRRTGASAGAAADPFLQADDGNRGPFLRDALSHAASGRIARRHRGPSLSRGLGDGASGLICARSLRRRFYPAVQGTARRGGTIGSRLLGNAAELIFTGLKIFGNLVTPVASNSGILRQTLKGRGSGK